MHLVFFVNTFENDYEIILNLLRLGAEHSRVKHYLCSSFQVDINNVEDKNTEEIDAYLRPVLSAEYANANDKMDKKLVGISDKWSSVNDNVEKVLHGIFECEFGADEIIHVFLSINYVCPYDFNNRKIYINYRKTTDEIIEACIHELIHYYWFKKIDDVFENTSEYDAHLMRKLSEIAIDALFKETELNKYCVTEKPAHKHFYNIEIENENMIEHFRKLFSQNSIYGFMKKGLEYLVKNQRFIPD